MMAEKVVAVQSLGCGFQSTACMMTGAIKQVK